MSLYKFKMLLKQNKFIKKTYDRLFVNKKAEREEQQKRKALSEEGIATTELVEKLLSKAGAQFFMAYGSLLGMVRDQRFLPHDNDIDYSVMINEAFTWNDLEKALTNAGMTKIRQFVYKGKITEQTYRNHCLTVDFFKYTKGENECFEYMYYRKDDYMYRSSSEFHVYKQSICDVGNIGLMQVGELSFHAPENPETYLAGIYGASWRVPDPNWQPEDADTMQELEGELAQVQYIC